MKLTLPSALVARLDANLSLDPRLSAAEKARAFDRLKHLWEEERQDLVPTNGYLQSPVSLTFRHPHQDTELATLTTSSFYPLLRLFAGKETSCYMAIYRAHREGVPAPLKLWFPPTLFDFVPHGRRSCMVQIITGVTRLLSCHDVIQALPGIYHNIIPDDAIETWQAKLQERCQ